MALALFDLDNTLIGGDSDHLWGEFLCQIGAVDADEYRLKNDQFFQDYQVGSLDIFAYNEFCLAPLSQHPPAQLEQWQAQFLTEIIAPLILPEGQEQISKHQLADDKVIIITATNAFVTQPIADYMDVQILLATTPEIINSRYTGKIDGTPCFQEGKVSRLNTWLTDTDYDLAGSYFYSDSINDLPLLKLVEHPVAVDPDEKLRAHAKERAWPITSFRSSLPENP